MKEKTGPIMEETTSVLSEDKLKLEFNNLPEEMIIKVLSFLSFYDKLNARLVCKLWHRLSFSISLIGNDVTVLDSNINLVGNPTLHSQHTNIRLIINKKNSMASSVLGNCTRFWQDHCMNVRSVEADVKENISWCLLEIMQHFPAIEHITMDYKCSYLHNSGLAITKTVFTNLRSLSLEGYAVFLVPVVNIVLERAPKLEKVVLRCYRPDSEHRLSTINFSQAQGLKEISLAGEDINDELIASLADNVGANLERLLLFNTYNCKFSLSSIDTVTNKCVNLKHLLLSHVLWDKPSYLKPFLNLNSLTALSLRYVKNLTDDNFATLVHLDKLSHFEMCYTSELTKKGISEVLCAKSRPAMIELRLLEFFHIKGYDVVKDLAPNFPNLKVLYAESSDITVTTLEALIKYNLSLQCLTLIGNFDTTPSRVAIHCNNAMNKLVHMDVRCTHISWSVCQYIKFPVLETFIYNGSGFQKIKNKDAVKLLSSCFYDDNQFETICSKKELRLLTCCKSPFVRCFIQDV